MQIIDDGKHLLVYSDNLKTYDNLNPEHTYAARFEGGMNGVGWYLSPTKNFKAPDFKIYGSQINLVDDVLESFQHSNKSIGVILSGDKGTGKTIFSKLLSIKAHELGLPTVIMEDTAQGTAGFIAKIDTPSVVMFDEFEKKFQDTVKDDSDTQNDMLSLFDGVMGGKNIYVITVNDLIDLSPFILNRPGRFMYSIRMKQPAPEEVKDYLEDKVLDTIENREEQIKQIIQFSFKVPLSYDILDTLVFQLNLGKEFEKVLPSLNLMNFEDKVYAIDVEFDGGYTYHIPSANINLFSETIKLETNDIRFDFQSKNIKVKDNHLVVEGGLINRVTVEDMLKNKVQSGLTVQGIDHIEIRPVRSDDFGYTL